MTALSPAAPDVSGSSSARHRLPRLWIILILLVSLLYVYGTVQQAIYVNHGKTDQEAYEDYSLRLYNDPTYIDGARMPLFPLIVRFFYQPGMSNELLFELGKLVGIGVSIIALASIAIVFHIYFSKLLALNLLLITAFTIFVFKAPWYQPELLFFTLYFLAFVLMCRAFSRLTVPLAIAIGLLLGVAMLVKASALPGLGIFVVLKLAQLGYTAFRSKLNNRWRVALAGIGSLILVGLIFALLQTSYIASSKRIFGVTFYNVNSSFYMWYDSWDDAVKGTRAHGDRVGWPDMPANEIPSMSQFLATHHPREIFNRVIDGLHVTYLKHCTNAYSEPAGYCKYVVSFGVVALVLMVANAQAALLALRRHFFLILFCALFILAHILMAAWWVPISPARRFLLVLYLPLMFVLASILTFPWPRRCSVTVLRWRLDFVQLFLLGVLIVSVADVLFTLTSRVFWFYGGD